MKKTVIIILSILLVLFAFSCSNSNSEPETGSIHISIDESASRSIDTNIDLNISKITINASGPAGHSFSMDFSSSPWQAEKTGILVGEWTFSATAYNEGNQIIGEGSTTVTVQPKKTSNATIRINELEGTGTFSISILGSTTPSIIYTAHIYKNNNGVITQVDEKTFTAKDGVLEAVFTLNNGYYLYSVTSNVELDLPAPESFRMVKGDIITVSMTAAENSLGSLSLSVTNGITKTPSLTIDTSERNVYANDETTLLANYTQFNPVSYMWYVDGKPIDGNSPQLNYTFQEGEYRVTCVAMDEGSTVWTGSKTINVTVSTDVLDRNRLSSISKVKNHSEYSSYTPSVVMLDEVVDQNNYAHFRIALKGILPSGEEEEVIFQESNGTEITQGEYGLINYFDCGDMIFFQFAPSAFINEYSRSLDYAGQPGKFDGSPSVNGFTNDNYSIAYYWSAVNGYIIRHPKDAKDFISYVMDKGNGRIYKIVNENGENLYPALSSNATSNSKSVPVTLIKNNYINVRYEEGHTGQLDYIQHWEIDQERYEKTIRIDSTGLVIE